MAFVVIKYSEIPVFLEAGAFYRSLSTDDPESTVCIPADCFAEGEHDDPNINDVCQLLRVTMFWMLDAIPQSVLHFCHRHVASDWQDAIAALPGVIESRILPDLLTAYSVKSNIVPLSAVIKTGRWELIEHTIGRMDRTSRATAAAAEAGDVRVLKFLVEKGYLWHKDTCAAASRCGHLDCLQFARQNGCVWGDGNVRSRDDLVCVNAAANGHLHCLQYAHEQGASWWTLIVTGASATGQLKCLRYALEHGCPRLQDACYSAARNGRFGALLILRHHGLVWDIRTSAEAATCAEENCLQLLHENGCPWDGWTVEKAALCGRVKTLRYAMHHGCPIHYDVMNNVLQGGNLECLQYLVEERQLPLNNAVFIYALLKGKLANLRYLLTHGCPFIDAHFTNTTEDINRYNSVFIPYKLEFIECVWYAMHHGWVPNEHFINYIAARDPVNCATLLSELVSEESLNRHWLARFTAIFAPVHNVRASQRTSYVAPPNVVRYPPRLICTHQCQTWFCFCSALLIVAGLIYLTVQMALDY